MIERRTLIWRLDPIHPDRTLIEKAAHIIRSGGLVAFPTETVYGLGANALSAEAVARIYIAKERPASNPVIVHVIGIEQAISLVTEWPERAQLVGEHFWPGPLTLVLARSSRVPDIIAAGGSTVAIRCPKHGIARALIEAAGVPIAAPSANRSSAISPTLARHVLQSLAGRIDAVLDGGPTTAGLESTVLDLSREQPRLLRPGPIPLKELEALLGPIERFIQHPASEVLPSPGLLERHYAPRTPLEGYTSIERLQQCATRLVANGLRIGVISTESPLLSSERLTSFVLPNNPEQFGAQLYAVLHELDEANCDRLLVLLPPDDDEWMAVRDRLLRASAKS